MKHKYLLIPAILLAAAFIWLLAENRQQERQQAAHIRSLQQQAQPYERELSQLRQRLQQGNRENQAALESSGLTVGFVPGCLEDVAAIETMMEPYAYTPLVILDCSLEWQTLEEIASDAMERGFAIIPAGITFDDQVLAQAVQLRSILPEGSRDTFFLRDSCDTPENMDALTQSGFCRFSRYDENLQAGIDENDCPWVAYGFIRSSGKVIQLLNQVAAAGSRVVLCIDFQNVNSGELPLPAVESFLKTVDQSVAAGSLRYSGLEASFQALTQQAQQAALAASESARQEQQMQNRIQELEQIISEIYSHWDEY